MSESGSHPILDVFGGARSQVRSVLPGYERAINIDIIAIEGVRADALHLPFRAASVEEIITNNPYIRVTDKAALSDVWLKVMSEFARVLRPGGRLTINAVRANPFIVTLPREVQARLRLRVIMEEAPLEARFRGLAFFRTNGTLIAPAGMVTSTYEKEVGHD
jgi:SAM-dependent methyltransferase